MKKFEEELLSIKNLKKYFPIHKGFFKKIVGYIKAVDDISFNVKKGEILGIVGESGCGKTTTGKVILRLEEPTSGEIYFSKINLCGLNKKDLRKMRKNIQIIFQDPYSSLNPRMTVSEFIGEPLEIHKIVSEKNQKIKRIRELLERVGLSYSCIDRYPHEFSGGQRQRIGIARALAVEPKLIIADEPVSALDVSVQAQVINLMQDLQENFQLTYIFIAHDLSVVKHIGDRIAVMYLGKIVEIADKKTLYKNPLHPYTKSLLSSIPIPDPKYNKHRIILKGDIPSPANIPLGCRFHTRCPEAINICKEKEPEFKDYGNNHFTACHLLN